MDCICIEEQMTTNYDTWFPRYGTDYISIAWLGPTDNFKRYTPSNLNYVGGLTTCTVEILKQIQT